jgi:uncharacterized protein DUF1573
MMRRLERPRYLATATLCLALAGCSEHEVIKQTLAAVEGGLVRNVGFVEPGTVLVEPVRLRNTSTEALRLGAVKRSCSCTDAVLDRQIVPPGEECVLTLTVDTSSMHGSFSIGAFVLSEGADTEVLCAVSLTGRIRQRLAVRAVPDEVPLGRWKSAGTFETEISLEITCKDETTAPRVTLDPAIGADFLIAVVAAEARPSGPHSWAFPLGFRATGAPAARGPLIASLKGTALWADGEKPFSVPLRLSWTSDACLQLGAQDLFVGRLFAEEWIERSVEVDFQQDCSQSDIVLEPDSAALRAEFTRDPDGRHKLTVAVRGDPGTVGLVTRRVTCRELGSGVVTAALTIRGVQ